VREREHLHVYLCIFEYILRSINNIYIYIHKDIERLTAIVAVMHVMMVLCESESTYMYTYICMNVYIHICIYS